MNEPSTQPRRLRERKDEAAGRLFAVWIATLLSGALTLLLLGWVAFDTGEWRLTAPYLLSVPVLVALAWLVYRHASQSAAGMLLILAIVTPVIRWMQTGRMTNLIMTVILLVIYLRGFQATVDLAELREAEARDRAV